MIENIKNDELSILCGIPKEKRLNIVKKIVNELIKLDKVLYIDYENNKNILKKEIKNNIKIICKSNKDDLIKDMNTNISYIIINYPGQMDINNSLYEVLQNYAHNNKKHIVVLSEMPK